MRCIPKYLGLLDVVLPLSTLNAFAVLSVATVIRALQRLILLSSPLQAPKIQNQNSPLFSRKLREHFILQLIGATLTAIGIEISKREKTTKQHNAMMLSEVIYCALQSSPSDLTSATHLEADHHALY